MNTKTISANSPEAMAQALEIINHNGIVAFPTDTVYGVGSTAFDQHAVESIYAAKQRPIEKAIPVLIGSVDDLDRIAESVPPMARIFISRFWPVALTCVLPKKQTLPPAISATDTVAVRMPDHPVTLSLLRSAGPMAVTSANISGQSSPVNADEVQAQLGGRIPLIIDGGKTPGGIPSTLVDCTRSQPEILREGPVTLSMLIEALK